MKKILFNLTFILLTLTSFTQGLQVTPPSSTANKTALIPHSIYPSNFIISEPQILSIDLNDKGDKIVKIQKLNDINSLIVLDLKTGRESYINHTEISSANQVQFISEEYIALNVQKDVSYFEIIDVSSSKVSISFPANKFIGSTVNSAYFSNQSASGSSIEKLDIATMSISSVGSISGEVFGWYFSKIKGIVGVGIHRNMLSNVYTIENNKIGKSLIEFSSNYYFETKGCSKNGDVFFGITNFQSSTTYACSLTKAGLKPLNNKTEESCTDIFILGDEIGLTTSIINAAEYQESKNSTVVKILNFAHDSFKSSSVKIIDFAERSNSLLFCVQGETTKLRYFVHSNSSNLPVSSDNCEAKNLTFITSETVQFTTNEQFVQSGRMYLPTKEDKATYPLIVYIPKNIFIPYPNQFNPIVQHLCQNGFAVFVWNTRYTNRPKDGFWYSDLVSSFPEDFLFLNTYLKKEYPLQPEGSIIIGEGLGGYLALNGISSSSETIDGVVVSGLIFPGKEFNQDLIASRMFGEDAQTKWKTLDRLILSEKTNYLFYSGAKSNTEKRMENANKINKIKWTEITTNSFGFNFNARDLDGIINWVKYLRPLETQIIDNKLKVEVKKK